jgi:Tol biopolymer transport system component
LEGTYDGWIMRGVAGMPRGDAFEVAATLAGESNFVVTGHTSVQLSTTEIWNEVYTAALDLTGKQPPTAPVRISPTQINRHMSPSWSPDGNEIAFYDADPSQVINQKDTPFLAIKDVRTGQIRRLHPKILVARYWPQWTPDGKTLRVFGSDDLSGKTAGGWYAVNVASEESHPVWMGESPLARFLPDGDSVIYADVDDHPRGIVWRQLSTGHEEVVVPTRPDNPRPRFAVSGDGRNLAYLRSAMDHGRRTLTLVVQPVRGGPRTTLLTVTQPETMQLHSWTPDDRHILFTKGTGGRQPVWLASVDGGAPIDMHFSVQTGSSPTFVHPDGRQIVFGEKISGQVLWTRPLPLEPMRPGSPIH